VRAPLSRREIRLKAKLPGAIRRAVLYSGTIYPKSSSARVPGFVVTQVIVTSLQQANQNWLKRPKRQQLPPFSPCRSAGSTL
jgi:hypothetical protein